MVCSSCGYPVIFKEKEWRHDGKFWLDPRAVFCDNYGYSTDAITEDEWKISEVEDALDGKLHGI